MRKSVFAVALASMAFAATGATVERVFARQMWPWQTHFEVSYVLRTSPAEAVDVSLKVSAGGDEYTIPASELLGETVGLTAGEYKLVWDSTASSAPSAARTIRIPRSSACVRLQRGDVTFGYGRATAVLIEYPQMNNRFYSKWQWWLRPTGAWHR